MSEPLVPSDGGGQGPQLSVWLLVGGDGVGPTSQCKS